MTLRVLRVTLRAALGPRYPVELRMNDFDTTLLTVPVRIYRINCFRQGYRFRWIFTVSTVKLFDSDNDMLKRSLSLRRFERFGLSYTSNLIMIWIGILSIFQCFRNFLRRSPGTDSLTVSE
jgi:hypothetical protein